MGKVAQVPIVMQMEALECGAASLCMILAYYGKWVPLEIMREDCGVSRDGSNAKNILVAARNYGMDAKGYKMELNEIMNIDYPCIIHWNLRHYVVLCGFRGGHAIINDPGKGNISVSMREFDRSFTGIALLFEPTYTCFCQRRQQTQRPCVCARKAQRSGIPYCLYYDCGADNCDYQRIKPFIRKNIC